MRGKGEGAAQAGTEEKRPLKGEGGGSLKRVQYLPGEEKRMESRHNQPP